MKTLRYIVVAIVALVILLIVGIAVFVYTFDPNQYRADIERLVKDRTGRTLTIHGDIGMSLYPRLAVSLGETTLSERDPETEFVRVKSAEVSVKLLPLLRRDVLVDGVQLDGLRARVVRDADGQFNFSDLTKKLASSDEALEGDSVQLSGSDGSATELTFDVAGVNIKDATLAYVDEGTEQAITVRDLELNTQQIALQAQGQMTLTALIEAAHLPMATQLNIKGDYQIDLPTNDFMLNPLTVNLNGELAGLKKFDLALKTGLHAALDSGRIELLEPELTASEKGLMKASLRSRSAAISAQTVAVDQLHVTANVDQPRQKLGLDIQTPAVTGSPDHILIKTFEGTLMVDLADVLVDAMKIPIKGNLDLDLAKSSLKSAIEAKVDDSNVHASLNMPSLQPAVIRTQISVNQLDLDPYLTPPAKDKANKSSTPTEKDAKPSSGTPIDLSALKGLDIDGQIEIGSLTVQGFVLENLKTGLNAQGGVLRVGPHSVDVSDGTIKGDLTVNANNNRFGIEEIISDISINRLLTDIGRESRLEGRADLSMKLSTQAHDTNQVLQNLNGTAKMRMSEGAIRGVDIARLLRSIQSIITSGKLPTFSEDDKTVFSELSASVEIDQGVAKNNDLMVKAPLFRVEGNGEANLVTEEIDYKVLLAVVDTTKGQEGPELEALRGVNIPIQLRGTFSEPSYGIDIASLAARIARSKAGDRVTEKLEKTLGPETAEQVDKLLNPDVTDKVKEKLKGLFGR